MFPNRRVRPPVFADFPKARNIRAVPYPTHLQYTVLDRSAHVMYRRRHRTMEVTVKRGVSESEMDLLMSKILAQQVSAPGCLVVMVKGNKRYPMGPVSGVRVKTLRSLVYECLDKYSTCGLHLVEGGKVGSMAKKLVNSAAFKVDVQRHRGLFAL